MSKNSTPTAAPAAPATKPAPTSSERAKTFKQMNSLIDDLVSLDELDRRYVYDRVSEIAHPLYGIGNFQQFVRGVTLQETLGSLRPGCGKALEGAALEGEQGEQINQAERQSAD